MKFFNIFKSNKPIIYNKKYLLESGVINKFKIFDHRGVYKKLVYTDGTYSVIITPFANVNCRWYDIEEICKNSDGVYDIRRMRAARGTKLGELISTQSHKLKFGGTKYEEAQRKLGELVEKITKLHEKS